MDKISDSHLIELVKQGDAQAYEELYQRYHKLAFYYAYKLCRNDADAKDVVQESFIEIHRSIGSLKENSYFKAWMYKIVNSKSKKLFRKNKHVTNDFEDDALLGEIKEERIELLPEALSHFKNDQEVLQTFIDQLPEAQRSIIILFYLEQFSLKEIAEILDIPIGTVKSRLSYARTYLKKILDAYQGVEGEPITFHTLDAAIALALSSSLTAMTPPIMNAKGKAYKYRPSSNLMMKLAVGTLTVSVAGAGFSAYQQWSQSQKPNIPVNVSTQNTKKQVAPFHAITIKNEVITNPQDAYFTLIEWACCKEIINEKTKEEISLYLPLYEELKLYGGPFYERLVEKQWVGIYEEKQLK